MLSPVAHRVISERDLQPEGVHDHLGESYTDILATHRGLSYVSWALQSWAPSHLYDNGGAFPQRLKRVALIHRILDECRRLQSLDKEPKEKARQILEDIAHNHQLPWIRFSGMILGKLMDKLYTGVYVHRNSVERVRSSIRCAPMLLLPTHRSYVDFLITPYLCFYYHLPLPLIAAGEDFKHMKGIGTLLRNCCAFYLRRRFRGNGDDELYRHLFEEYAQSLIKDGSHPIEFFIEGTRSRTGKSLRPRFGLFNILLETYFRREIPDVTLVPVGITYDRTLEESLHVNELLGIPKPKESTTGFFKGLTSLNESHGGVHVNFGLPISTREFFSTCSNSSDAASRRRAVEELGLEVVVRQQRLLVVPAFGVVLAVSHNGMFLKDVIWAALRFSQLLQALESPVCLQTPDDVMRCLNDHPNVVHVGPDNRLHFVEPDVVERGSPKRTMRQALPALLRQYYVNQTTFGLFCPVMFFLSHCVSTNTSKTADSVFQTLTDLFSREFVTEACVQRRNLEVFSSTKRRVQRARIFRNGKVNCPEEYVALRIFLPTLKAYAMMLHVISSHCQPAPLPTGMSFDDAVLRYRKDVEELWIKGELEFPEMLSKELSPNCLQALIDMNLVVSGKGSDDGVEMLFPTTCGDVLEAEMLLGRCVASISPCPLSSKAKL